MVTLNQETKQMIQKEREMERECERVSQGPRDVSAPMVRGNLISVTERSRSFVVNSIQETMVVMQLIYHVRVYLICACVRTYWRAFIYRADTCLSICLSFYLSVNLSIHLFIYLFMYLNIHPSIYLSPYQFAQLSVPLSVHLSINLSVYPPIYPSLCVSIYRSFHSSISSF